jgi:hypothetical protein
VRAFLFISLWAVVIVGGLPRRTQEALQYRLSWWPAKEVGLLSAALEALAGYGLVRVTLAAFSMERVSVAATVALCCISTFLLLEGGIRFLVTYRQDERALPSLPVWAVAKLGSRLRSSIEGLSPRA